MAYWLLSKVIWGYAALPFHILDHMMVTYLSRSARDCSCTKPRACINSWTVTPDPVHSGVCREMVCLPPRAPRYDQHLRYRSSKMMRITQNNHAVPQEINMMFIPCFGLNVQEVPLVSSGHEAHTGVLFNEFHAFFNVLYLFFACAEEQSKPINQIYILSDYCGSLYENEKACLLYTWESEYAMYTFPFTDLVHRQLLAKQFFWLLPDTAISPSLRLVPSTEKTPTAEE